MEPYNDAGWTITEYDALIDEAKSTNGSSKYVWMLCIKQKKSISSEMPIIPIYFYTKPYMVK